MNFIKITIITSILLFKPLLFSSDIEVTNILKKFLPEDVAKNIQSYLKVNTENENQFLQLLKDKKYDTAREILNKGLNAQNPQDKVNPNVVDKTGNNAMHILLKRASSLQSMQDINEITKQIKIFADYKINLNSQNDSGNTPLMEFLQNTQKINSNTFKIFLEIKKLDKNFDKNIKNNRDQTIENILVEKLQSDPKNQYINAIGRNL